MTTGTMLLMWLGEQITERGIGNGVSLIITIGIWRGCRMAARGVQGHVFPGGGDEANYHIMGTGIVAARFAGRGHRWSHRNHAGAAENSGAIRAARRRAAKCIRAARHSCRCA